jgi:nucleotide-binding universal stress UspA family protein
MFKKLLVPVDDSALTEAALTAALGIAGGSGQITLLTIHAEAASLDREEVKVEIAIIEREIEELKARALDRAHALGMSVAPKLDATVRVGAIASTIVDTAEELRSDLIVMGTHGRHGVAERLIGSTAERVVASATCAVLVVKPEGYPFLRD